MFTNNYRKAKTFTATLLAVAIFAVTPLTAFAQTRISAPSNRYKISDDVQAGREAAQQVEQQMPILNDRNITNYVADIGARLVAAIPPEFQHPEFRYSFKVVNARDINAFALPGGYSYVNRGLIEAAQNEGQLAGVMAHEISHAALRHATAQATETQKYQIGSVLGQIAGAVIGGGLGGVIAQGSQIGFGIGALKYSRKYETQADLLGAQIMARAGYDPRDLAEMFRIIERTGGNGTPEFLSSHPNPGNRYQRINQEAALLRVNNRQPTNNAEFARVKAELRGMGRAPSMSEIAQNGQNGQRYPTNSPRNSTTGGRVEAPSSRYRTYNGNNLFRISVPENWRDASSENSVALVPQGGYLENQGRAEFTHGVLLGVERTNSRNLRQASAEYINQLLGSNQYLRQQGGYQSGTISGRNALAMTLVGRSDTTGAAEQVTIYTTLLSNGDLFYMTTIAPQSDSRYFQSTFQNMLRSVQLNDR